MKKVFILIFIFTLMYAHSAFSQSEDNNFKALYLYNVTKFIKWPDVGDNFLICAPGEPKTFNKFREKGHINKSVGEKSIKLQPNVSPSDIPDCQIYFLPESHGDKFETALSNLEGEPTLLVTNGTGLTKKGSAINFGLKGGNLTLEICQETITQHNLEVNDQLLQLGEAVCE